MITLGIFGLFSKPVTDKGVSDYKNTPNAVLLDVRTPEEYAQGHIPDSINIPLSQINDDVPCAIKDKNTPLFVYCRSGARSSQAASQLKRMGYISVVNIGGILDYTGEIERG